MHNREPKLITPAETANEIKVAQRRELAVSAVDAVSEIFDNVFVNVPMLLEIAQDEEVTGEKALQARLNARRALRAIATVGREDSEIMRWIGSSDVYHYTEAVVRYGASNQKYLELIDKCRLSAEEATNIYGLRKQIADHSDGRLPGFQKIIDALSAVGLTVQEAALDTDAAIAAFDEAGFFIDHATYDTGDKIVTKQFDRPLFYPTKGHSIDRIVEDDIDGSVTEGIRDGLREQLAHPAEESDETDENSVWRENTIREYLKSLDS